MKRRVIKPTFFSDPKTGRLSPLAQVLFIGMWCLADQNGYLEHDNDLIRAQIFPYHSPEENIQKIIDELIKARLVITCNYNDKALLKVSNLRKHQPIHPHEAKSEYPETINVITCNDTSTDMSLLNVITCNSCSTDMQCKSKDKDIDNDKGKGKDKDTIVDNVDNSKNESHFEIPETLKTRKEKAKDLVGKVWDRQAYEKSLKDLENRNKGKKEVSSRSIY